MDRRTALILFLLALVLRVFFLPFSFTDSAPLVPDDRIAMDGYYQITTNLLEGDGFRRDVSPPMLDSVRTPLYPLFIAGVISLFHSYKVLLVLQVFIGSVSVILVWLLARAFLKDERLALIVGILMAVEPLGAYLTGTILTETLFCFLFFLTLLILNRYLEQRHLGMLALAALVAGIATLVKPTTQFLPIIVAALLWYLERFRITKRLVLHATTFAAVFLVVLSPWLYRNYRVFNNPTLTVQPVSNLFAYLVPSTIALERNVSLQAAADSFFAQEGVTSIEDINLGNATYYKKRAVAELVQHPVGLVQSLAITGYAFFLNDNYAMILQRFFGATLPTRPPFVALLDPSTALTFAGTLVTSPAIFVAIGRIFWLIIFLFALWGAYRYMREHRPTPTFLLYVMLILYFAATTAIIGLAVNGRFRLPVDPFLFMFAVYGAAHLLRLMKHGSSPASK